MTTPIVFNHPTCVVVSNPPDGRSGARSLHLRDPVTRRYERLPARDDGTSYQSPVVGRAAPYVMFNVMRYSEGGSGSWLHVARADLRTRRVEVILTPDELLLGLACAPEWPLHPWVAQLVGASDDARMITCEVGVPLPRTDGGCRMSYWLFDLDVEARSLTWLIDLRRPPEYET